MIRLIGAVLLAASAAGLGLGAAVRLRRRTEDLRGLLSGLSAMERVLSHRMAPLVEMLEEASLATTGQCREFFSFCQQGMERLQARPFSTLWETAMEGASFTLESGDLEILSELGPVLGRYDADSQSRALKVAVDRLERQSEEAVEQQKRMGKVYGALGISAGLFLIILVI